MSMMKPIAQPSVAFDATTTQPLYFTSSGGNQVVKNRLTIRDNGTNTIVYQHIVESFLFKQDVPLNTLTNGTYYNFYFNTYDVDDNISPDSNVVAFYCYSAPTITLVKAPSTNKINSTSYSFTALYDQTQDELLDYLIYYLYDSNGNELSNSGRLYSTQLPPITFSHLFSGFKDNTTYSVQVKAVSVNGTLSSSIMYEFLASFHVPFIYTLCSLENNAEEGYVNIQSNVVLTEGVVEPAPPLFISDITDGNEDNYIKWGEWFTPPINNVISQWAERVELDISNTNQTLSWSGGVSIPSDFQIVIHMDYTDDGKFTELFNSAIPSNKIYFERHRGIPYGETVNKMWVTAYTTDGKLSIKSNYVDMVNGSAKIIVFLNKVGNTYSFIIQTLEQNDANYIEINGDSNAEYGVRTDIEYVGEEVTPTPFVESTEDITNLFPLDTILMYDGIYDNLDVTTNILRPFSINYPTWDYYTRLNCTFSSLSGGNLQLALSQIESIRIKRRLKSGFDWITLYNIPIVVASDLNLTKRDNLVPTGEMFEYAIVPVMSGGVEGDYIMAEIETCFNWCYLCDKDTTIKFYSDVAYPTITSNPSGGLYVPLGRPKPIAIYNSVSKYESGTFTGKILGVNFLNTRQINRKEIQTTINTYKSFMTNNEPKMLKDWDGRIRIVALNIDSGLSEGVDLKSGISNVSFSWSQLGDYDSQQDLYDGGFVEEI